jgi:hypothetical protein
VRHETRLSQPQKDGQPLRAHLALAASRGIVRAREALAGPPFPEALAYLLAWAYALHGRSGVGELGFAPLTYTTVADWSRLMGLAVAPHEVEALMQIDGVMRHPGEPGDGADDG